MSTLAIIPARAGSLRCPGKNAAMVGKHSLVGWSIIEARESKVCDQIVVSTNDTEVMEIAKDFGCCLLQRPESLAQPDTPMLPVVKHTAEYFRCEEIILLQPTSPLRTSEDIAKAYELFHGSGGDSLISVTEPPEDLIFELGFAKRLRPALQTVVPNGAIYIIKRDFLDMGGDWYSGVIYAYEMPKDRSLDIDTPLDLEVARLMASKRRAA